MKKLIPFVVVFTLLLSSCGSATTTNTTSSTTGSTQGSHVYATDEISIQIPDEWEVITALNLPTNTPKDTAVAFRSNIRNPQFTPNVVIIKNTLTKDTDSLGFAKGLYQKMKNDLVSVKEIIAEQTKISVGGKDTDTVFTILEGRESPSADLKRYVQLSGVSGKNAFIATGSYLAGTDDSAAKKIEAMVRSFGVK